MKAMTQVFVFIITLCLCEATMIEPRDSHRASMRREVVSIAPSGLLHQSSSEASMDSTLAMPASTQATKTNEKTKGKLESGGLCLAAERDAAELHMLEMVSCDASADLDDEEWEESGSDTPHQIELADDHLCLEADESLDNTTHTGHHRVHLTSCSSDIHSHHHRQLWIQDATTKEIKMAVDGTSSHKCLTTHDHNDDGDDSTTHVHLVLSDCETTVSPDQEWVFDQAGATAAAETTIKGKIEQEGWGLCLAARRHTDPPELEMVSCSTSSNLDDEEWETGSSIIHHSHHSHYTPHQIELADDHLCLEASDSYDSVHLTSCSSDMHSHHHRQLWIHDDVTDEIQMAVRDNHSVGVDDTTAHKCLTTHDHDADDDTALHLVLQDCATQDQHQDWVFAEAATMVKGEIEQTISAVRKCVAAHQTSNGKDDLEVVGCQGDGDDDEEWEAHAAILHAPEQIKINLTHGWYCLEADDLLTTNTVPKVELQPCLDLEATTHDDHHRQLWTYDAVEKEIKIEVDAAEHGHSHKCLSSEPDTDGEQAHDGPEDDLVLRECDDDANQIWEFGPA